MRLTRLPAVLLAGALLAGTVSCATTIEGSGTLASDVVTGGATPDPDAADPAPTTAEPTTAAPTTDPVLVRQRLLCVLERAAIVSVNSQFNKQKDRDAQIRILRTGASTIQGHIRRSALPTGDRIRRVGQDVLDQLNRLVTDAAAGNTPSTRPYNTSTDKFQKACATVS